jgi:DNA-binding response OmpR family regulator/anti-sigma regulatory factor (Ser/Thr protein kinase)
LIFQDIVEEFKPLARRKGLALRQKSLPSHIFVDIDVYLYDRILFNLLSNAVKFTPQGGTISLSLTHKNQRVALRIQDSGIGIPPEELPKLFQKFRQVEGSSTRRYEGTGLGLALVKEFARLLEGDVRIESPPGQGTTVTVDCFAPDGENSAATAPPLPAHLSRVPSYDLPDPGRSFEPPSQADSSSLLKVLVVEDNAELSAYIAKLISPFYQVKVVADGELALSSARDWLPDLILSDVMMPKRDGFSLCTALKAEPETAKIPVILLTALTHREAMLKGWEVGADEYLFKPFHPKELLTRVRSILSSAQVKQDARKEIVLKNRVLEGLVRTLKEAKEQLKNERDQLREANKAMDRVKSRAARLKQEVNELRQSRQSKAA